MSVNPKVIATPVIAAVAMNGIEVKAKAKVTVRANIDRLVGGAGEETIIARVGEGIVTTIGSAASHTEVLETPIPSPKLSWKRGSMPVLPLKSCLLILPTSMWGKTLSPAPDRPGRGR